MNKRSNRVLTGLISAVCLIGMVGGLTGCNKAEKNISVVVREQGHLLHHAGGALNGPIPSHR